MKKQIGLIVINICLVLFAGAKITDRLKVSVNHHYLVDVNNQPFFWLADTGWEMLNKLSREEIALYLENRKSLGFNVIQTVILSEFSEAAKTTNFYRDSIFICCDPERTATTKGNNPNSNDEYDFWDHVDYAVKAAESKGMYLALLPTWGEWVTPRLGKPLFNTRKQAYQYGWFLGDRYKESTNIIWILGGDRMPDERANGIELWRAMAEGITDGVNGEKNLDGKADYTSTLMTFHCFASSSQWFQNDEWLDFNMWGSYHAEVNNAKSFEQTISDWNLKNPKPTINGEPCYERALINYAIPDNGYFTSTDVRQAAYWSVFSGAAGFTYGANSVWNFEKSDGKNAEQSVSAWKDGINYPGAVQVGYLKKLFGKYPMDDLVPDQSLIIGGAGSCGSYACAIRGKSHLLVYIPTGNRITLKFGTISGNKVKAGWFDPRTGESTLIGEFDNVGQKSFEVPAMSKELTWLRSGRGCDWVLVLEDAEVN